MAKSGLPAGWLMSGSRPSHYSATLDAEETYKDASAIRLSSKKEHPDGFGTCMRMDPADDYHGKHIRMRVWLKSEDVNVAAQPWVRVDGPGRGNILSFDNFCQRQLQGDNDWTLCEAVVAVPEDSEKLAYGFMLSGPGTVWCSPFEFEAVNGKVATTDCPCFERSSAKAEKASAGKSKAARARDKAVTGALPRGWMMAGSQPDHYQASVDDKVFHSGTRSAFMSNRQDDPDGFGTLMQICSSAEYAGKRVRMTCWLKTEDVETWTSPWLSVDGKDGEMLAFDNFCERPVVGTTDWKRYQTVLAVAEDSTKLRYGVLLSGAGRVWMDDFEFEAVGDDVDTTDCACMASKATNLDFEN